MLAIAEAAVRRGHECLALLNPADEHLAASRGVSCRAYGTRWTTAAIGEHPAWLDAKRGSLSMLRELMAPRASELAPALREAVAWFEPKAVVHHQASFGVAWATEPSGVPRVTVSVAPAAWPSVSDPNLYPPMPDLDSYPSWTIRLGSVFGRRAVNRAVDPALNAARRELGMPPSRRFMFDEQMNAALNIGMWSPGYRGPTEDDPANAVITGFPGVVRGGLTADAEAGRRDLERFEAWAAERGERPIVAMSLGTTAAYAGLDQAGLGAEIAERVGVGVVVLGGIGGEGEGGGRGVRGEVLRLGFVPHGAVLPRCAAVVHHGGIGTVAQTLRAGKPAVVAPFTHDQPDNARRLRLLGLGVPVGRRELRKGGLWRAVERVVSDGGFGSRAAAFAERLCEEDGGAAATVAIEERIGGGGD